MDVLVAGAGPAGWAAAAALRSEGLRVALVAPDPMANFRNGYGVWVDELEDLGLEGIYERVWPSVRVHIDESDSRRIERSYARINNRILKKRLVDAAAGTRVRKGLVKDVAEGKGDTLLTTLDYGERIEARVVIDASGHESRLILHGSGPEPGWQVAHGRRIEVDTHPFALDEAVLMDFRPAEKSPSTERHPSFLYVLPEDSKTVFVEETSLVARPAMSIEVLERRLEARLSGLGIRTVRTLDVERCFIPMGGPDLPPPQSVVAFGGAARMVHPASGYLLARILRTAPVLARAVRESIEDGRSVKSRSRQAWDAVWSRGARASHDLQRFGTEVLIGLETPDLQSFFGAFFSLPEGEWRTYLSGMATPAQVRTSMRGVFARAGWRLRFRLMQAGISPAGAPFRRSLFTRG